MTACRVLALSLYTRIRRELVAGTVQIVLPDGSYRGARTKYASADTVAVFAPMPSRFQPTSNWSRSISVFADTCTEPSGSALTWTGSGTSAVTPLMLNVARRAASLPGAGSTAVTPTLRSGKRGALKKTAD